MSAFAPEISAVLQGMTVETSRTVMGTTYYFATYPETPGRHYLVFQTNVSMVNAAAAVQKTIMLFPLDRLVFSGIAGGVDDRLNIGDVVAPLKWIEYQENILGREVSGTYTINPWQYSPFPNYKERFIAQVDLGSQGPVTWFDVPQYMIEAARNVSVTLESCTASNICLEKKPKFFVGGPGEDEMNTFFQLAADNSAKVMLAYLKELP
jgi:adenosylhomocysteine nucleosidase